MASDTHGRKKREKLAVQPEDELLVPNLETPVIEPEPGSQDAASTEDDAYLIRSIDEDDVQHLSRSAAAVVLTRAITELSDAIKRLIYAGAIVLVLVMGLEDKLAGNVVIALVVILVLAGGGRELLSNPTTRGFLKKLLKFLESGDDDDQS